MSKKEISGPLVLTILDGFGRSCESGGNAVLAADTPNLGRIFATSPYTLISASGGDVGLPDGQMGNSEVGHTNIGAGRVVYQELTRISKTISDGEFEKTPALLDCMSRCKRRKSALHIMGLLSDGGVHSHIDHLFALLEMAKEQGVAEVYVHCFLDGRDVSPSSGVHYVAALMEKLEELGTGEIATIMGRFYAMDRDNRWNRVKIAYEAMIIGKGEYHGDPVQAVEDSYEEQTTDEFVEPIICSRRGNISPGDGVVFFNFRPDRAREITRVFTDPNFLGFERIKGFFPVDFVCMTSYDAAMPNVSVAFAPSTPTHTFGEVISQRGLTQLRIAETEKYAHVTFFFNGGEEKVFPGEERILVPSPRVERYDLVPEMSADEVTDRVVEAVEGGSFDVIILNYANCDMVGHTGNFGAAVRAVEAVDRCMGRVHRAVEEAGGVLIVTADHGNAEQMLDSLKQPHTAHTLCPVPFAISGVDCILRQNGVLADIAPTMLEMLGIEKPEAMTGTSLIENSKVKI